MALTAIAPSPSTPIPIEGTLSPQLAEQLLVQRNREIQVARRAVEVAEAGTLAAGGRPNATVSFDASRLNLPHGLGGSSDRSNVIDSILRIDQPFERGGKRELRRSVAGSALDAAKLDLNEAQRQQLRALRQAYADWGSAIDLLDRTKAVARSEVTLALTDLRDKTLRVRRYLDEALPAARRASSAAEFAYSKGAASVLELLDARRQLRAVELEAVSLQADYAKARAALAGALNRNL